MNPTRHGYFLVGPTAVGKTAVMELASERMSLPILSADSMTIYRGMNIGTAKPTAESIRRHRYMGIDLVDPTHNFSVAEYLALVRGELGMFSRVLVAGGTGLYVRCLIDGLSESAAADTDWRAEADRILKRDGVQALQAEVKKRAPEQYAALRDPQNPRRLIRAAERADGAKQPGERKQLTIVGLRMDRQQLANVIRERVNRMYASGFLDEVAGLRTQYAPWSETARKAIGYAEALTVLDGGCTVSDAREKTILRTIQFSKRQMTWFKGQAAVDWIDVLPDTPSETTLADVQRRWENHGPTPLCI